MNCHKISCFFVWDPSFMTINMLLKLYPCIEVFVSLIGYAYFGSACILWPNDQLVVQSPHSRVHIGPEWDRNLHIPSCMSPKGVKFLRGSDKNVHNLSSMRPKWTKCFRRNYNVHSPSSIRLKVTRCFKTDQIVIGVSTTRSLLSWRVTNIP